MFNLKDPFYRTDLKNRLAKMDKKKVGEQLIHEFDEHVKEENCGEETIPAVNSSELVLKVPEIDESKPKNPDSWYSGPESDDEPDKPEKSSEVPEINDSEDNIKDGSAAVDTITGVIENRVAKFNNAFQDWLDPEEDGYSHILNLSMIKNSTVRDQVLKEVRSLMVWANQDGEFKYKKEHTGLVRVSKARQEVLSLELDTCSQSSSELMTPPSRQDPPLVVKEECKNHKSVPQRCSVPQHV